MQFDVRNTVGALTDSHMHSIYSFDGCDSVVQFCEAALAAGLSEITFTDHLEIGGKYASIPDFKRLAQDVAQAKQQYAGRLGVHMGVELGQPQTDPQKADAFYEAHPDLDFIIGSQHNMNDGIDAGACDFSAIDPVAHYANYLDNIMVLARDWDYDVLGHLTYPLRYMQMQIGRSIDLMPFKDRFRALFAVVVERGHGIEVNVSGYRQPMGAPYPSKEVLEFYRDCGGEIITLGSDSHFARDVGKGVREGTELLRSLGFRYVMTFEQRKPVAHPL